MSDNSDCAVKKISGLKAVWFFISDIFKAVWLFVSCIFECLVVLFKFVDAVGSMVLALVFSAIMFFLLGFGYYFAFLLFVSIFTG
jgi:hypothetical protein